MAANTFVKTALSHPKLRLRGVPYVEGSWESPELQFDIFGGHPQIVVWSKHPAEANKKDERTGKDLHQMPIKASTSLPRLRALFAHMRTLYGKNEPVTHVLRCLTTEKDAAGNTVKGKRVTQAKIVYGRHPEGHIFLEIRNAGRPILPFKFVDDTWHQQEDDTGQTTIAELSEHICEGYISTIEDVYMRTFVDNWDPDWKPQPRGSNGSKEKKVDNGWSN